MRVKKTRVLAILPAAGSGKRMGIRTHKPFVKLAGKELVLYALKALDSSPDISGIIVACSAVNMARLTRLIRRSHIKKIAAIVKGGKTRSESVHNALCCADACADIILIHDAARPFVSRRTIRETVSAAKKYSASLAAVPVKPTIKQAGGKGLFVSRTIDRSSLWEAQTPQVFKRSVLLAAYKKAGKNAGRFTDDASLVENCGKRVKLVMGDYNNIKITTPVDLEIAEAILKKW